MTLGTFLGMIPGAIPGVGDLIRRGCLKKMPILKRLTLFLLRLHPYLSILRK